MATPAPSLPPIREGAVDEIPVIDLGPYLAGEKGAREVAAKALRHAFENIGFYFITSHGVPRALIDGTFDAAHRFHNLPLETKLKIKLNEYNIGYLPM
ncbi:MAG: 2-oxoglutarate and iron-dependent oxygenase domain-containing protein, partial [Hyphomicrobiaceae bacterium]